MPTTEAGKRLLEMSADSSVGSLVAVAIDAIEAEAREQAGVSSTVEDEAERLRQSLAYERARIRAAVEGLFDSPALYPSFWGDTIRKENEVVRAVLRIIDGEDA